MIAHSMFFLPSTKILEGIWTTHLKISQQTTKQNANFESFKWQVAKAQMRLHDERLAWTLWTF